MNYYVFIASDKNVDARTKKAKEYFDDLVVGKNVWGFGLNAPNRHAIKTGDKAIFYLSGAENQVFVGTATLKSGAYQDESCESKDWFDNEDILRIDLEDVRVFSEPKSRRSFTGIEWRPTPAGSSRISEHDYNVIIGAQVDTYAMTAVGEEEMEFALEKYLENFIVDNWGRIDFGEEMSIFEDEDGNTGKQYLAGDAGYIDILAKDRNGNFVVIELKKGRKNDEVIGQILRYMGWVRQNLCKNGEEVCGLIIVREKDLKLEYALNEISTKVQAKRYTITFRLTDYSS